MSTSFRVGLAALHALTLSLVLTPCARASDAANAPSPQSLLERGSYSLGHQTGLDMQRQGLDPDPDWFARGMRDARQGGDALLDEARRRQAMGEIRAEGARVLRERRAQEAEHKREAGRAFLAENVLGPGVMTTPSGMQYRILKPGTGKTPTARDTVTVHYRGTLINGEEFDSSHKRGQPASFPLSGVIRGWTEGLQLIQEGGSLMLYIPPELAYGDRGRLAHETLIFEVELLSVKAPAQADDPGNR